MLRPRLRLVLLLGTVALSMAWWGAQEEDPNAKVAIEVEESLEERKAWNKLSLEGSKDAALKAIAMHKARVLREAKTPEEEEAARAALASLLSDPSALAEVLGAHLSDGTVNRKYRTYVSATLSEAQVSHAKHVHPTKAHEHHDP